MEMSLHVVSAAGAFALTTALCLSAHAESPLKEQFTAKKGDRCAEAVAGVAWDYNGSKNWNPANVQRLCKGNPDSIEPAKCFRRVMHGGINWGGGTKWQWKNAIDLCEGAYSAKATVRCFRRKISNDVPWQKAIKRCNRKKDVSVRCGAEVRKIAWDYKGSKNWNPANVKRLCKGAKFSAEPAKCFKRVMHGGINWGGGTQWQWKNAIDLCEGTKGAKKTIGCFKKMIAAKAPWKKAIGKCETL